MDQGCSFMSLMSYNNVNDWSNLPARIFLFIAQSFRLLGDCLTCGAIPPCDVVKKEDYGDDHDTWSNLPPDILEFIVGKFSYLRDYYRFSAVCKSWRDSLSKFRKPCLPLTEYPFLLLAEDVAPGAMLEYDPSQDYSEVEDNDEDDDSGDDKGGSEASGGGDEEGSSEDDDGSGGGDDDQEEDNRGDDDDDNSGDDNHEEDNSGDDEDNDNIHDTEEDEYDHNKISVGSSRGLYSLLTGKTYCIDLPEAAGRLIKGTNKGWLVTLGRDLQINLLHPLLNHQISLPPMPTFPQQMAYDDDLRPEDVFDMFIFKVVVCSSVLNTNSAFGSYPHQACVSPYVMAIYSDFYTLGFTRLGDKVWKNVKVPEFSFDDIVYHKGNVYAVNCHGNIFVCGCNGDEEGGDIRGREIARLESRDWEKKYLVESTSGSGLLLLVRYRKELRFKYRTTGFSVWRLDLKYSDSFEDISCCLKQENDLGNESIFVGNASSTAVSLSEIIKPNCIYFTDDNMEYYYHKGGGHDMGIFSMEHHSIEPHFQGKSYHPISPPLWYI